MSGYCSEGVDTAEEVSVPDEEDKTRVSGGSVNDNMSSRSPSSDPEGCMCRACIGAVALTGNGMDCDSDMLYSDGLTLTSVNMRGLCNHAGTLTSVVR